MPCRGGSPDPPAPTRSRADMPCGRRSAGDSRGSGANPWIASRRTGFPIVGIALRRCSPMAVRIGGWVRCAPSDPPPRPSNPSGRRVLLDPHAWAAVSARRRWSGRSRATNVAARRLMAMSGPCAATIPAGSRSHHRESSAERLRTSIARTYLSGRGGPGGPPQQSARSALPPPRPRRGLRPPDRHRGPEGPRAVFCRDVDPDR